MVELRLGAPRAYRIARAPVSMARDGDPPEARAWAPDLRRAIRADVVRPLIADRCEAYLAILVALLAAQREGDEAPTLDELRRRVRLADEDDAAFLRDLLQLEAWGCLRRELEPARVRGYSDARRDRFRHRLADDAAALLGWLEARVIERERVHVPDARERLADVMARLVELSTILASGAEDVEARRRGAHLVRAVTAELDAIERSLVQLDTELRAFAERRFDAASLERIVRGLEDFLCEHVAPVQPGRAALAAAIDDLERAGLAARWSAWCLTKDAAWAVAEPRARLDGRELLEAWRARLAPDGALDGLARRVEASTRAAIHALRAHVRRAVEESLSPRGEIEHALRRLATCDDEVVLLGLWGERMPTWAPGPGGPIAPPLPRRRVRAASMEPIAVEARAAGSVASFSPEARRLAARAWLERALEAPLAARAGSEPVRLSALAPSIRRDEASAATWMTIAKARHLGRGHALSRWGVRVEPVDGSVTLGDETRGMVAPDCALRRVTAIPGGGAR